MNELACWPREWLLNFVGLGKSYVFWLFVLIIIWKLFSFHSKETLIIEPEKNASRIDSLEQEKVDDEEEGKKDESSCSSEEDEEDDSESEAETGKIWRIEGSVK